MQLTCVSCQVPRLTLATTPACCAAAIRNLETLVLTNNKIADVKVRACINKKLPSLVVDMVIVRQAEDRGASYCRCSRSSRPGYSCASLAFLCGKLHTQLTMYCCRCPQDLDPLSTLPHLTTLCLLGNPVALKKEYRWAMQHLLSGYRDWWCGHTALPGSICKTICTLSCLVPLVMLCCAVLQAVCHQPVSPPQGPGLEEGQAEGGCGGSAWGKGVECFSLLCVCWFAAVPTKTCCSLHPWQYWTAPCWRYQGVVCKAWVCTVPKVSSCLPASNARCLAACNTACKLLRLCVQRFNMCLVMFLASPVLL